MRAWTPTPPDDMLLAPSYPWLRMLTAGMLSTTGKDVICNYATYLQKKYQTEIPSVSIQWPPPPTDKVFNLAMIEQETTYLHDEEFSRLLLHGDVAGAMHEKKEVKLEDIVKPDKKRNVILIEGAPGAGKSTLAWHICQKWSTGELFGEFIMIIFMELRDIAIQSATTLANILFPIERGPKPEEVLAAIKNCDGAHILFVLDGWDEFPPGLHGDSMVKDLICRPADVGTVFKDNHYHLSTYSISRTTTTLRLLQS